MGDPFSSFSSTATLNNTPSCPKSSAQNFQLSRKLDMAFPNWLAPKLVRDWSKIRLGSASARSLNVMLPDHPGGRVFVAFGN